MTDGCPACGRSSLEGEERCAGCGLPSELFGPIREAISLPTSDPRYEVQVRELLDALGEGPARPRPAGSEPTTPAVDPAQARSEIEQRLALGARLGLDLASTARRLEELGEEAGAAELAELDRELGERLRGALSEQLEAFDRRRRQVRPFFPELKIDAELDLARLSFEAGDLDGAQAGLAAVARELEKGVAAWGKVERLLDQSEMIGATLAALGHPPTAGREALAAGRKAMSAQKRAEAERRLAEAVAASVAELMPLLQADLAKRIAEVARRKSRGESVEGTVEALKEFHLAFKELDYVRALTAYRRAAAELGKPLAVPKAAAER